MVAAPIFKRIAEASLRHLGIAPTVNPMPPVLVARHEQGAEPAVQRADAPPNDLVGAAIQPLQPGVMPDLHGQSAREAVRTLTKIGASARMTGRGVVVEQAPAAGEPLGSGEVGVLRLGRQPAVAPAGGRPQ